MVTSAGLEAVAAMAGHQALAGVSATTMGLPKPSPSCRAARICPLPLRKACQATHTRPSASVAAAG